MKSKAKDQPSIDGVIAVQSLDSTYSARSTFIKTLLLLAIANVSEGLGQHGALVNQPLKYLMLSVFDWHADKIALFFAILSIPWTIKPVWGFISDKFPFLGYKRKSYLFVANALAVVGFGLMTVLTSPFAILMAMMLTTIGMAAASTLCGGVLVENGQRSGRCGTFVNQQWLWFSAASIVTSLLGGWLCNNHPAPWALHTAALIVFFPPIVVMLTCSFLLEEKRIVKDKTLPGALLTYSSRCWKWIRTDLLPAFQSRAACTFAIKRTWTTVRTSRLSLILLFCFCYNFSPSFGTPLYTYQIKHMHFSQEFIGQLGAIGAIGGIVATVIGFWLLKKLSLKALLYLCIILGTVAQGAYLWQSGFSLGPLRIDSHETNQALSLVNGIIGMWSLVVSMTLCARYCPKGLEGFTYAIMASVFNIAGTLSEVSGAWMFVHWFKNRLSPLILFSCVFTLIPLLLIPALQIGKEEGEEKQQP
jgi:BT1 family